MPNGCVNTYPFKCAEGFMPSSTLSWRVYIRSVQVSSCLRLQGCGRPGCYKHSKVPALYFKNQSVLGIADTKVLQYGKNGSS